MIWFAWINGSLYIELHGSEDGRTRNIVFVQMCILALLAMFTAGAAQSEGLPFSRVYVAFLLFMTWLWYTVRDQDRDRPEFLVVTAGYVIAMAASAPLILISGFLPPEPRLVVWAAFVAAWCGGLMIVRRDQNRAEPRHDRDRFPGETLRDLHHYRAGRSCPRRRCRSGCSGA
jgi:low temperature requirement protein LtrA